MISPLGSLNGDSASTMVVDIVVKKRCGSTCRVELERYDDRFEGWALMHY